MCTNFLLNIANDASAPRVSARCLELAGALPTSIFMIPRGQAFPLAPPPFTVNNPQQWNNQYGFIGVADPDAFSKFPCFMDGMNEVGLTVGALWLPDTGYPQSGPNPGVAYTDLVAWVLGNYATVEEVLSKGLPKVSFIGPVTPQPGATNDGYVPLHFIITDPSGASLVLEFINGTMNYYQCANGVLTNAPPYNWQLTNLHGYANLTVVGSSTQIVSTPDTPPVGSGMLGLPGDSMSSSRFVRATKLIEGYNLLPADGAGWLPAPGGNGTADATQTLVTAAMQLVQIIQTTPYGTALVVPAPPQPPTPLQVGDWTMWSVVRDHTNRKYYFTTAFNGVMRCVDLNKLDFGSGPSFPSYQSIPLLPAPASFAWFEDATTVFAAPAPSPSTRRTGA